MERESQERKRETIMKEGGRRGENHERRRGRIMRAEEQIMREEEGKRAKENFEGGRARENHECGRESESKNENEREREKYVFVPEAVREWHLFQ